MRFQSASFLSGVVILLLIMAAQPLIGLAAETDKPLLTVPVRVHLMTGLEFDEKGKTINTWVTPMDFTDAVLPEMNRIWKPAAIQWKAENVVLEAAKEGPELHSVLKRIAKREPVEIPTFRKLFADTDRRSQSLNLYLVPSVGQANGIALRGGAVALVAVWRPNGPDDHRRAPLVRSERGTSSVAKACAHELGHTLGLVHPDERRIERLMQAGPGTELTPEEIATARLRAAVLAK